MELITFIFWLVVTGIVVGALARLIIPGRQSMGLLETAVIGIVGSFIGGVLYWAVADHPAKHPVMGFVIGVICAAAIVYFVSGGGRRRLRF
jgi:uncharacterized membrane protein YeaQ/YmgE (transglycosylase-associated protein family)